jgi:hypothetical protein
MVQHRATTFRRAARSAKRATHRAVAMLRLTAFGDDHRGLDATPHVDQSHGRKAVRERDADVSALSAVAQNRVNLDA